MISLGLLGGTFDPIHCGHLRLAIEVRERVGLDEVLMLPAGRPRLRGRPSGDAGTRLALLELAVEGVPGIGIDAREIARPGPTYTVDTLEAVRAERPDASISFVLGLDAYRRIERWHRFERLLELAHLIVARRPRARRPSTGVAAALLEAHRTASPATLRASRAGQVLLVDVPAMDISATEVRRRAAAGRSLHCLVPDPVRARIEREGPYTNA